MSFDRRTKRQRSCADPVDRYLGELQAEIMRFFWENENATVADVEAGLNRKRRLAHTTVLTLVTRLWARGLLERQREGRRHRYAAAKSRDQFLRELSDELIDRLFSDFGDIAVAQLGERFEQLDPARMGQLSRRRQAAG